MEANPASNLLAGFFDGEVVLEKFHFVETFTIGATQDVHHAAWSDGVVSKTRGEACVVIPAKIAQRITVFVEEGIGGADWS